MLEYIAGKRLAAGRLTVVDATNVQPAARKQFVELARAHDVLPVAIVLDLPKSLCAQRNASRPDRTFGAQVIAASTTSCAARSGRSAGKGSAKSTSSAAPPRSTGPWWSANGCSVTTATGPGRST